MRWFKHLSTASQKQKSSDLLDETGPEGYGVWWLICERISVNLDAKRVTSLRISLKNWANFCRITPKKFKKLVVFMKTLNLLSVNFEKTTPVYVTINIPNLLKYLDEYTGKQKEVSGVCQESVRSLSGATPVLTEQKKNRTEEERDKKEKKKKRKKNPASTNSYHDWIKEEWMSWYKAYIGVNYHIKDTGKMHGNIGDVSFYYRSYEEKGKKVDTARAKQLISLAMERFFIHSKSAKDYFSDFDDSIFNNRYKFGFFTGSIDRWALGAKELSILNTLDDFKKLEKYDSQGFTERRIKAFKARHPDRWEEMKAEAEKKTKDEQETSV